MIETGQSISLKSLTLQSFKIGCLGFGGPAGQISLMHRIFVDQKKWIDEPRFLHALNYCMLLPGPEAQQLAVYVGWLSRGVVGGVIAGALFVVPGAFFIFALSWLYATQSDLALVAAVFYGVKAAVLAIVAEAMLKIGKRALNRRSDLLISIAAFFALFILGAPFPLVILLAAISGAWRAAQEAPVMTPAAMREAPQSPFGALLAALAWLALWLGPVALAAIFLGGDHIVTRVGFLFSQLAVVTFGGAYAVLSYLQQQAVDIYGWLSAAQMIDGLGLAETTPGPLVLVNQFVGFLAGWNASHGLGLAAACALMASWCTFAPSFLWIFAGAPFAENLRHNRYAAGALKAITAAVLGIVANLALWFAIHVVFKDAAPFATPWGHIISMPMVKSIDPAAAILAVSASIALIRYKANMIAIIFLCGVAGVFLS